jgi:methionine-S-sulfoxide reductase
MLQKAIFAAGCFWGVEYRFSQFPGVVSTRVGYTGGLVDQPSYEQVCTDSTGHAEAVEIVFEATKTAYEQLLEFFFSIHDPTTPNRQGPDIGTQYRSAIYYFDELQRKQAWEVVQKLKTSKRFRRPIVTEIKPAEKFYAAEDYHQQYYSKQGRISCGV